MTRKLSICACRLLHITLGGSVTALWRSQRDLVDAIKTKNFQNGMVIPLFHSILDRLITCCHEYTRKSIYIVKAHVANDLILIFQVSNCNYLQIIAQIKLKFSHDFTLLARHCMSPFCNTCIITPRLYISDISEIFI